MGASQRHHRGHCPPLSASPFETSVTLLFAYPQSTPVKEHMHRPFTHHAEYCIFLVVHAQPVSILSAHLLGLTGADDDETQFRLVLDAGLLAGRKDASYGT